jgi:hypothetical protein
VDLPDKITDGGTAAADEGVAAAADRDDRTREEETRRGREDSCPMSEGRSNFHAEAGLQLGQDPCRAGFQTR